MSDDDARPDDSLAAVASGLQDQIDDLTASVEAHQLLFERLRATGVLRGDDARDSGSR